MSNRSLFTPALLRIYSFHLYCYTQNMQNLSQPFHLNASRRVSSFFLTQSSFHSRTLLQATLALSLVVS